MAITQKLKNAVFFNPLRIQMKIKEVQMKTKGVQMILFQMA